MDEWKRVVAGDERSAALLILSFLQADRGVAGEDATRDVDICGCCEDGGTIESDGHLSRRVELCLDDILPSAQLPENRAQAAFVREVAAGLRDIAAQLERRVVDRATQNLSHRMQSAPCQQWRYHLGLEVQRAMRQGVGLRHLPEELVVVALGLALVRGVCERAPRLGRDLFEAALLFVSDSGAR